MTIHERIRAAGLTIPDLTLPSAAFLTYTLHGDVLIVSGQLPVRDGKITVSGKVPDTVSIEDAKTAARLCVANLPFNAPVEVEVSFVLDMSGESA